MDSAPRWIIEAGAVKLPVNLAEVAMNSELQRIKI